MAHVDTIWFQQSFTKPDSMKVKIVTCKGASDSIDVPVPPEFKRCVLAMAQAAADLYEQQLLAELIAQSKPTTPDNGDKG